MCSLLDKLAVFNDQNSVGADDSRQTVGDNDHCPIAYKCIDGVVYGQFVLRIQCRGGLIEDDDWGVLE